MKPEGWDLSISPHRPLHWYADQSCYWITGATLLHTPHFRGNRRHHWLVQEMLAAAEAWSVDLVGWTVMEHHYHAILRVERGRALPRFLGRLHGRTAILANREDCTPGRQVWRQYWDTFLRSEGDFWCWVNYMWWNPVKHGFCRRPEEWPWTNLAPLVSQPDAATVAAMQRFPAPRKFPGDEW